MHPETPQHSSACLGTEKTGRLLLKFSVPCVLSMLVSALYNIVDQIFIGRASAIWATPPRLWSTPSR